MALESGTQVWRMIMKQVNELEAVRGAIVVSLYLRGRYATV